MDHLLSKEHYFFQHQLVRIAVSIYSHLLGGLCERLFHCHRLLNRVEIHLNQCDGLTNTDT